MIEICILGDRYLLEKVDLEVKENEGILIPQSVEKKYYEAKVIGVGNLPSLSNIGRGDLVLVNKMGGIEVKVEGKKYMIVGSQDILARLVLS